MGLVFFCAEVLVCNVLQKKSLTPWASPYILAFMVGPLERSLINHLSSGIISYMILSHEIGLRCRPTAVKPWASKNVQPSYWKLPFLCHHSASKDKILFQA